MLSSKKVMQTDTIQVNPSLKPDVASLVKPSTAFGDKQSMHSNHAHNGFKIKTEYLLFIFPFSKIAISRGVSKFDLQRNNFCKGPYLILISFLRQS